MTRLSIALAIIAVVSIMITLYCPSENTYSTKHNLVFIRLYNDYFHSFDEMSYRYKIFKSKADEIDQHNKGNHTWVKGFNRFSVLTVSERTNLLQATTRTLRERSNNNLLRPQHQKFELQNISNKINWNEKGYVSPAKDQLKCQASYALSVIDAIESAYLISNKNVAPSAQEIVDCTQIYGNEGCKGGSISNAFKYIKTKSVSFYANYPYTGAESQCKSTSDNQKITIKDYKICPVSINSLIKCILISPTATAIFIKDDFFDYESGIYDAESSCGNINQTNASVLTVGYDLEAPIPFVIIKNSWGATWGQKGFANLAIGQRLTGPCYIAGSTEMVYPIV